MSKPLVLVFKLDTEKGQTWRYKETDPGMIMGGFYFSKLAMHFWLEGKAPTQLKVTVEAMDSAPKDHADES
jgi:hypothetical protein